MRSAQSRGIGQRGEDVQPSVAVQSDEDESDHGGWERVASHQPVGERGPMCSEPARGGRAGRRKRGTRDAIAGRSTAHYFLRDYLGR